MTAAEIPDTVRALADDSDLRPLWEAVHSRLCSGVEPKQLATVSVRDLPIGGVAVLRSWLDTTTRRRRTASAITSSPGGTRVPLRPLLAHFDLTAEQLPVIAELATGKPVVNRASARRAGTAAREELWARVTTDLAAVPRLARRIRASGVADDDIELVAQQARHLRSALVEIDARRIPGAAPVTLAKLAHDCTGDPHSFDLDRLTGRRLVEAVAELLDEPEPDRPDAVRALLLRAGVLADRLSTTVLTLNLPASGTGVVDQRLRLGGGPVPLTLYDLTVNPPVLDAVPLLVVENPSVLEAAMANGFAGAMACTSGHLRAVDHAFLHLAVRCGAQVSYAGDTDRDGLLIAKQVQEIYGARLVAMGNDMAAATGVHWLSGAAGGDEVVYQENDAVLAELFHT